MSSARRSIRCRKIAIPMRFGYDIREFIGVYSRCVFEIWHSICMFIDLTYSMPSAGILTRALNSRAVKPSSPLATRGDSKK
jgi:hypothetical protein